MSEVIKKITEFQEHSKMLDEIFHCADIRDAAQNMLEEQLEVDLHQLLLEQEKDGWKIEPKKAEEYNKIAMDVMNSGRYMVCKDDNIALYDGVTFGYNPYQE